MAKLLYVGLNAGPDIAPIRNWYVEKLGLRVVHQFEDQLVVLAGEGGAKLNLERGPMVSEPERIDLIFEVADVDAVFEALCSKGVTFSRPPKDEPYGQRVAILSDPLGHRVELYTPIQR